MAVWGLEADIDPPAAHIIIQITLSLSSFLCWCVCVSGCVADTQTLVYAERLAVYIHVMKEQVGLKEAS